MPSCPDLSYVVETFVENDEVRDLRTEAVWGIHRWEDERGFEL